MSRLNDGKTPAQEREAPAKSKEEELSLPAESREKEVPLPTESKVKDELQLPAESKEKEVPLPTETKKKDELPLPAESKEKDKLPLTAESEEKDEVPLPAESEEKDKLPLLAESKEKEKLPLPAESKEKDEVPLPAESKEKDKLPLSAESEEKKLPLPAESEEPLPAKSKEKLKLPLPAESKEEELPLLIERMRIAPSGGKKLLILSVNGLLVEAFHGSTGKSRSRSPDFVVGPKLVFKRPFCDDFLRFCFDKFRVAVWSSMMWRNAMGINNRILGPLAARLLFNWDQSKCRDTGFMTLENQDRPLFLKELKKVWKEHPSFSAKNTLLVDDKPYKALLNPPNTGIFPRPYEESRAKDMDLGPGGEIMSFLEGLAEAEEVPSYVAAHPVGQEPITAAHPEWSFYSRVVSRMS